MTTRAFTAAPGVRLAHATAIGIPLRPAVTGLDRPALRGAGRRRFGLRPGGQMRYAYAAADFAVCRAGAMTCAELAAVGLPAAYVPSPLRGGEQRHNAEPAVAADGSLLVDDAGHDPAWIEATLIPELTDPQRVAAMSARASAAGAPDAGVVLARHVLTAVAGRRRLAS